MSLQQSMRRVCLCVWRTVRARSDMDKWVALFKSNQGTLITMFYTPELKTNKQTRKPETTQSVYKGKDALVELSRSLTFCSVASLDLSSSKSY